MGQLENPLCDFLLQLDADVLARVWPGNRVLTGLRAGNKTLRDRLRHHPAPAVVGSCDASHSLSSTGSVKRSLLNFAGGASITLHLDSLFQLSSTANKRVVSLSQNFDKFCDEFKEARRSGWQGPTQLTLTHTGHKYVVLTHAQTAALGRCLLDLPRLSCFVVSGLQSEADQVQPPQVQLMYEWTEPSWPALTELQIMNSFPSLLPSLCLTTLERLTKLGLPDAGICTDSAQSLARSFSSLTSLESLVMGKSDHSLHCYPFWGHAPPHNRLISDSGSVLAASLSGCRLRRLEVNEVILSTEDGQQLAAVLSQCRNLEELTMMNRCCILPEAATAIAPTLANCIKLRKVNLSFTNGPRDYGDVGEAFELLLRSFPALLSLEEVSCWAHAYEDVRYKVVLELLKGCRQLRSLRLQTEAPTDDEIDESVFDLTACDGRLKTLGLSVSTAVYDYECRAEYDRLERFKTRLEGCGLEKCEIWNHIDTFRDELMTDEDGDEGDEWEGEEDEWEEDLWGGGGGDGDGGGGTEPEQELRVGEEDHF